MKKSKNNFLFKLIASLCIVFALMGLGFKNNVYAEDEVFGGVLLTPVTQLLTGLGDGVMDLIHSAVLEQDETLIKLDAEADTWWSRHGTSVMGWLLGIAIASVIIIGTLASGGLAAFAAGGFAAKLAGTCFVIKTVGVGILAGTAAGTGLVVVARVVDSADMSDDIYLPVFNLTPEEIFSNKIWMFDVNFFEPEEEKNYTLEIENSKPKGTVSVANRKNLDEVQYMALQGSIKAQEGQELEISEAMNNLNLKKLIEEVNQKLSNLGESPIDSEKFKMKIISASSITVTADIGVMYTDDLIEISILYKDSNEEYLKINCMEHQVFSQGITSVSESVNITFSNVEDESETIIVEKESIATTLRGVISKWYFILRNLALLILMVLLIYSGIRIVIGSTAGEKAKHKERIMDWLVAMCLVFLMHYIMVFAVELNEKFIELVDSANGDHAIEKYIQLSKQNHIDVAQKDGRLNKFIVTGDKLDPSLSSDMLFLEWPTNIMGGIRVEQQLVNEGTANWIGYAFCYLILVIYTVIFTWTYLRRVLYMAFLTMIAPLVAMTYPIDKITDGKAQAFNSWLKEYIFNLLIQPFHLLLYTILVTSAYELAGENALYAIVAIGFMTPAEKLLRSFFGFDKAQTPGLLGGAAGAALAMTGMQSLMKFGAKGGKGEENEKEEQAKIKYSSSDGVSAKGAVAERIMGGAGITGRTDETVTNGAAVPTVDRALAGATESHTDVGTPLAGEGGLGGPAKKAGNLNGFGAGGRILPELKGKNNNKLDLSQFKLTPPAGAPGAYGDSGDNASDATGSAGNIGARSKNNTGKTDPNRFRKLRTLGAAIGSYNRALGQKNYKRLKKSKPIRSLARGVLGAYGATLFGMAGLALGIASGDPSKAFQYTTAGVAGGFGVGKGVAGKTVDALTVDTDAIKDEVELAYYGAEYKKQKLQEEKDSLKYNEEYINYLRKTLGVSRKDAKKILSTDGAICLDAGIREIDNIAALYKMSEEDTEEKIQSIVEGRIDAELDDYIDKNVDLGSVEITAQDIEQINKEVEEKIAQEASEQVEEDMKAELEEAAKRYEEDLQRALNDEFEITRLKEAMEKEQKEIRARYKKERDDLRRKKEDDLKRKKEAQLRQQQETALRKQRARDILKEAKEEAIQKRREELRQEVEQQKEAIRKDVLEDSIAMKKFSDRTPDLSKLGKKKRDSYKEQFKLEMRKELISQLKERGYTEEQAKSKIKEERLDEQAAETILSGVIRFDDKKSEILKA